MDLNSSTALVTGGAVRIGETICRTLAAAGCVVAIHYNRSESEAAELVDSLKATGASAFGVCGDLRSAEDCRVIVQEVCSQAGGIDILVNNAAVFHKDTLLTGDEDKLMAELQVNMLAPKLLTQAFAEAREAGRAGPGGERKGRIVNLLDRRIAAVDAESLSYSISKKMLAEFTREAAVALAPGITVNGVAPGAVLPPPGKKDRTRDAAGPAPLRVQCTPDDVAAAVLYLVESDAVTGQVIFVDGGRHLLSV